MHPAGICDLPHRPPAQAVSGEKIRSSRWHLAPVRTLGGGRSGQIPASKLLDVEPTFHGLPESGPTFL
jgi:hypothetical protein